jgi:Ser/Thr protein kinase RdoA (MazF antagonist)
VGAPRTLGRDNHGRHVLEYIPGSTVNPYSLSDEELGRVGRLIREFHVAAKTFVPPTGIRWNVAIKPDSESMICHHDLAPWNLVRDGERWVFIDWDGSGPGSVLWEVAYAAQSLVPLAPGGKPERDAARLRCLVDGYALGREQREGLPQVIVERTRAMFQLLERGARTGEQPWARMYAEGHADHWRQSAAYVGDYLGEWKEAFAGKF